MQYHCGLVLGLTRCPVIGAWVVNHPLMAAFASPSGTHPFFYQSISPQAQVLSIPES